MATSGGVAETLISEVTVVPTSSMSSRTVSSTTPAAYWRSAAEYSAGSTGTGASRPQCCGDHRGADLRRRPARPRLDDRRGGATAVAHARELPGLSGAREQPDRA